MRLDDDVLRIDVSTLLDERRLDADTAVLLPFWAALCMCVQLCMAGWVEGRCEHVIRPLRCFWLLE